MGTKTTVEKIACAMAECGGPGNSFSELLIYGGATPSQVVGTCAHLAGAAIEALREPSEAMLTAGVDALHDMSANEHPALVVWQAMIDAALTEQPVDPAA